MLYIHQTAAWRANVGGLVCKVYSLISMNLSRLRQPASCAAASADLVCVRTLYWHISDSIGSGYLYIYTVTSNNVPYKYLLWGFTQFFYHIQTKKHDSGCIFVAGYKQKWFYSIIVRVQSGDCTQVWMSWV